MIRWLIGSLAALGLAGGAMARAEWSDSDVEILRTLWIGELGAPARDASNRVADNPAAAELGRALFFDARLSSNGRVSCATCHQPEHGFTDALPVGQGVGTGARRTMPVAPAVYSSWQFWDGRADSLWAQALGPVENPVEHGFTRTEVVRVLTQHYRSPYQQVFGELPDLSDKSRFPERASPVADAAAKAAWEGMAPADRDLVDRAFANFGKSLAAFERTVRVRPTRFDAYVAGVIGKAAPSALGPDEIAGLKLFIGKARCVQCHSGPLLTNQEFANTGVPAAPGQLSDEGRATGVLTALADPFNCRGRFSDASAEQCEELEFAAVGEPEQVHAFKVPSLRGVAQRAPFMEAGQMADLEEVIRHYNAAPKATRGTSQLQPLSLTGEEQRQLIAFLRTLDDPIAAPTR